MNTVISFKSKELSLSTPSLPQKRRLSSTCWERNWAIQFEEPLVNPHAIHDLASHWSTETLQVKFQLRTPTKICCVMRTEDCTDEDFLEQSLSLFKEIENSIGAIDKIEDRSVSNWLS